MRQLQRLAAIVGLVALGVFGLQAVSSAAGTRSNSISPPHTLVATAHPSFSTTAGGIGAVPRASSDHSTVSAESRSRTSAANPALSGASVMAAMVALLALAALGFIVLTFTRRRAPLPQT